MNTIEISSKFKNYLSQNNKVNLDANYLKQLNHEYQSHYDQLKEKDAINKFIGNMASYLKYVLSQDGYFDNPNPPQDYLTNLATIGTKSIIVYNGYVPQKFEKTFKQAGEKYLKQLFHLKNFNGFNLIFQYDQVNIIKLVWNEFNNVPKKENLKYNVIQHNKNDHLNNINIPLDIISPAVYNPIHPQFEELIKNDIKKNVSQLRSDLEKKYLHHRKRRHRHHKSKVTKTDKQDHLKIENIKKAIHQFKKSLNETQLKLIDNNIDNINEDDINKTKDNMNKNKTNKDIVNIIKNNTNDDDKNEDNTNNTNEDISEAECTSDKNIKNEISGNDGTTSSDYGNDEIKFVRESDLREQKDVWTTIDTEHVFDIE
jgi:hypothetical protein